jgi:hypothetical protein
LSKNKTTYPGAKQVYLDLRKNGWSHLVALEGVINNNDLIPLLDLHIKNGKICEDSVVDLNVSRKYCNAALINLHPNLSFLSDRSDTETVPVFPDNSLKDLFKKAIDNEYNLGLRRDIDI